MTFTLNVQEAPAASVAPDRVTLPDPAVAVMVPPPHEPVSPFGVATTTLAGNVSVNAIPVSGTEFPAGLVMVKLSVERSFGPIATGLNALLIEGGATTTMLAEAVPPVMGTKVPVPSSKVAVTFPLVLFLVPAVVPVTLTESEQEPFAGKFNDATLIVLLPGLSITSTPTVVHVPAKPLGLATTRPLGSVSLTEMFTSAVLEFGFVKEKVREVVPFSGMLAAPNALVMVGGDRSYGMGGYGTTPIEQALPVYMDVRDRQERPDLALVFVIEPPSKVSPA